MAQNYKIEKVQSLKGELEAHHNFIFTDYRGLNVQQINSLRRTLREKGAQYHVVKNRFAKRVLDDLGYAELGRFLINPTAIAYFDADLSDIDRKSVV